MNIKENSKASSKTYYEKNKEAINLKRRMDRKKEKAEPVVEPVVEPVIVEPVLENVKIKGLSSKTYYEKNKDAINLKMRQKRSKSTSIPIIEPSEPIQNMIIMEEQPVSKPISSKDINKASSKLYYEKNKEAINLKRREDRKKKAKEISNPISMEEDLEATTKINTFDDMFNLLSETHKKSEKSHLQSLFKILDTVNFQDDIKDAKTVINKIMTAKYKDKLYSQNTQKAFIQCLLTCITDGNIIIPKKSLMEYKKAFNISKLNSNDQNELKKENDSVITFPELIKNVVAKFGIDSKENVMIRLYQEYTLRDDFQLKIIDNEVEGRKDLKDNFLVVPSSSKYALKLIINNYKTEKRYGAIVENIPHILSELIRKYMNKIKIKYGEYLFGNNSNSQFVKDTFTGVGLKGSINTLRQMKISDEYKKNPNMSNETKVALSDGMKHSSFTQLRYLRLMKPIN